MFSGLSAFPLTPLRGDCFHENAYAGIVRRLVDARVDLIGALGSTGSYVYLDRDERRRVALATMANAGDVPVIIGIMPRFALCRGLRFGPVLALFEQDSSA